MTRIYKVDICFLEDFFRQGNSHNIKIENGIADDEKIVNVSVDPLSEQIIIRTKDTVQADPSSGTYIEHEEFVIKDLR